MFSNASSCILDSSSRYIYILTAAYQIGKLLVRIVKERAPLLADACPELPPYVTAAIDRALDKDPKKRWQTAREFATGLATSAPIDDLDWD